VPTYHFLFPEPEPAQSFEMAGLEQVRRTAVQLACAKISQSAHDFWTTGEWQMAVTDENGLAQFSLTFFAAEAPAVRSVEINIIPALPKN